MRRKNDVPLYEYLCRDCGKRFEILQRMGEGADGLNCPGCGKRDLAKQFSTFAAGSGTSSSQAATGCAAPGCGSGFT